ncbi:putative F-box protein At-B [Rosellinia necatrix]|uniref:Putative F-box protein At-B n=1 Tax=Rosellinia necatrix TaxID=77044 RepID=A0A1W2TK29_ROSNE|nr:putative F-box protein At-B [Rosellinia necatrix]
MDEDTDSSPRRRPTRHVPSRQAKIKQPARETRATAAYFTSSTGTLTAPSSTETDNRTSTRILRPVQKKRKRTTTTPATSSNSTKSTKRQRLPSAVGSTPVPIHVPHAPSERVVDGILYGSSSVSPPWLTLPYHVWLRVFGFIAAPIRDPASRIDDLAEAVSALLSGSRTCRATAEPALAALYKCPPFHRIYNNKPPQTSFVQFLRTLALPAADTLIRYHPKLEILRIDVDTVLTKKVNGSQLQLQQVLKYLPRLTCLELYHPADDPPYRHLDNHLRWKFSRDDLLDGLGPHPDGDPSAGDKSSTSILKSWRWNSRLVPKDLSLHVLPEIHALPCFRSLRKLAYINYQLPSTTLFSARARESQEAKNSDSQAIAHLAMSISALPDLQHLIIESSTLANGELLERLPKTLAHLELVNCWEITSEDLSMFLVSHGSSLVRLTLKHCQSLSLGFLPALGSSCPNLAHLEVDLSYFRHHEFYVDNKPEYATLLDVDQVPTWPRSIQSIEIVNMRNWTREAAEMFFSSLTKNAKTLPNLRRLEFKVILNIEWRQRQEMRRSLADRMSRVFKRKESPIREQRTLRERNETGPKHLDETNAERATTRRSTRIADQSSPPTAKVDNTFPLGRHDLGRAIPVRKSLRSFKPNFPAFDADDEDSSEDELSLGHTGARRGKGRTLTAREAGLRGEEFIHGLCDVVDIQVDNQRPAERQYDMDDFLSAPDDSDTEWNSDEDDVFG